MSYPVIVVPDDAASLLEQLGTKSKFWYRDEDTNESMLFKEGRFGTGENWSEKVCCEICKLLDLPHANYELAISNAKDGVVTNNFVPKGGRLIHGNELLAKINSDYDDSKQYRTKQHTVRLVMLVVGQSFVGFPLDWNAPSFMKSANEVLIGYLMLDALVSNQDRHHENWGLIVSGNSVHFAPSYDHASSLGRNETDKNRIERLNTKDYGRSVEAYVGRARSAFYGSQGSTRTIGTLDAFLESTKSSPDAAQYWLDKLEAISEPDFEAIFEDIPRNIIGEPAVEFALKMLKINTIRLLDAGK